MNGQPKESEREKIGYRIIKSEHHARLGIWSVGPTMLELPNQLGTQVEYALDVGPMDNELDSSQPFFSITATWTDQNHTPHLVRFGVLSCVDSDGVDPAHSFNDDGRYRQYGYRTQLVLMSPKTKDTQLDRYKETVPFYLAKFGCAFAWQKRGSDRLLAIPSPQTFTPESYSATKRTIDAVLKAVKDSTQKKPYNPERGLTSKQISQDILFSLIHTLHP